MDETKPNINPMPDMVLSPEERANLEQGAENKLPGAPMSEKDSVLLNTPQYARAIGDILEAKPTNSEQREQLRSKRTSLIHDWLKNPSRMENYFDALHQIQASMPEKMAGAEELEQELKKNLEVYLERQGLPSSEIFGKLIKIIVKSPLYEDLAKKIVKSFFDRAKSTRQLIDFMYELCLATLNEPDRETFLYGLKLLTMGTDVMPRSNEKMKAFTLATFGDDNLLRKQQEVDGTLSQFAKKYIPEEYQRFYQSVFDIASDPDIKDAFTKLGKEDPIKFRQFVDYFSQEGGLRSVPYTKLQQWPYNLTLQPGPVRKAFNRRVTSEDEKLKHLRLPAQGTMLLSVNNQDELNKLIKSSINALKETSELKNAVDVEFLFSLSPEFSPEQLQTLIKLNEETQKSIVFNWSHSISPRGDRLKITDKTLTELGFKSIVYEIGEPKATTNVTIDLDKARIKFTLDENYTLGEYATGKSLDISFEKRSFLEHVILSHLRELMCTDRVAPGEHDFPAGQQELQRKRFTSRRGHRRLLPPGQTYSEEARLNALNGERSIDLIRMNLEQGRTKETGLYTYVKRLDEVAVGGKGPLVSRAPHAMDVFHKVIDK